ncbi:Gfo/Idh/MocA family protein [Aquibacillus saliphilus]|uniref:Gfo/Idh/MocA family protein n=1 Tax=Aquibacillus saliphilus TaxID=1909422 RepID=UPI001CF04244|nr:Gfo/Idh/MocA family oxidoreductase [Aquibacillus saliphilus]
MRKVNYGVIGTGYFGYGLAKIIRDDVQGGKVVAVYDPNNAEEIARELDCDQEMDIESLCKREDIDAVIIASPNANHKEPVLYAAKHNKHVFCEKPIALSYQDCDQMIEITKRNDLVFMAGHVMNFIDGVREAKRVINDGEIGDILFCHAERTGWEDAKEQVSWKKKKKLSGGHLYHHIHELDFIQFLMGPATRVCMVGGNVAHQGEEFGDEDDLLLASLEFKNNTFATIQYGSAFRLGEHYVKIQGTKGAILIDLKNVNVVVKTLDKEERILLHASEVEDENRRRIYQELEGGIMYGDPKTKVPIWLDTIMKKELNYFHDVLLGLEVEEEFIPLLDGTAARAAVATADALTLSLKEDRKVSVDEIIAMKAQATVS